MASAAAPAVSSGQALAAAANTNPAMLLLDAPRWQRVLGLRSNVARRAHGTSVRAIPGDAANRARRLQATPSINRGPKDHINMRVLHTVLRPRNQGSHGFAGSSCFCGLSGP